ncbi:MAG TPA: PspC domain-containing protein [Candidatus Paceibacterota bacterium]|nr:PspC domain-containing protein [Candidatus Paceibacterota bacterium]
MFEKLKGKKLCRRPADAILFGVAAGLGEFLEIDVVFVRLALVLLAILTHGWPMLIAYVAAIVIMPINPAQDTVSSNQEPKDVTPPPAQSGHMDSDQNM